MSVICQNFVQNAWKKDLCSNCFKSFGDHSDVPNHAKDPDSSVNAKTEDEESNPNPRYTPQATTIYQSRNGVPSAHTTWKSLISEKNNKNSQPFKLESGFKGKLLTINNVFEKNSKAGSADVKSDRQLPDESHTSENKTANGLSLVKNGAETEGTPQNVRSLVNKATTENEIPSCNGKVLQGILKKSSVVPSPKAHARRSSNVGFKEEAPLVIGYGGRDFSPEELDWEMGVDGEGGSASDSLDETEEDKVISKLTKQNTEFNSNNKNLLNGNESCKSKVKSTNSVESVGSSQSTNEPASDKSGVAAKNSTVVAARSPEDKVSNSKSEVKSGSNGIACDKGSRNSKNSNNVKNLENGGSDSNVALNNKKNMEKSLFQNGTGEKQVNNDAKNEADVSKTEKSAKRPDADKVEVKKLPNGLSKTVLFSKQNISNSVSSTASIHRNRKDNTDVVENLKSDKRTKEENSLPNTRKKTNSSREKTKHVTERAAVGKREETNTKVSKVSNGDDAGNNYSQKPTTNNYEQNIVEEKNATKDSCNSQSDTQFEYNSKNKYGQSTISGLQRNDLSFCGKETPSDVTGKEELSEASPQAVGASAKNENIAPMEEGASVEDPVLGSGGRNSSAVFASERAQWEEVRQGETTSSYNHPFVPESPCNDGVINQAINTSLTRGITDDGHLINNSCEPQMTSLDNGGSSDTPISAHASEISQCEDEKIQPEVTSCIGRASSLGESAADSLGIKNQDVDDNVTTEMLVNETSDCVKPRASFLHGISSEQTVLPNAVYSPAGDLFVKRRSSSSSSSSSSSDENRKSQTSTSCSDLTKSFITENVGTAVNVTQDISISDSEKINFETTCDSKNPLKTKPQIPTKPTKPPPAISKAPDERHYAVPLLKSETADNDAESVYYSIANGASNGEVPPVSHYAESNIYQEVAATPAKSESTKGESDVARESKLAALAMELEQARCTNGSTKRQAPAPPKVPDPPLEEPPNKTQTESPHTPHILRSDSVPFSSASSTTSSSSQDTDTGFTASWNLNSDVFSTSHASSKSKGSFLLNQYSKCKMLALGYSEDGGKARKKFSLKKLLKIGKESDVPVTFDPNYPNPKAWKYSENFERPRAKLEIIHPMDLEKSTVTINPGFEPLRLSSTGSMGSLTSSFDSYSVRTSMSSDYGNFDPDSIRCQSSLDSKSMSSYDGGLSSDSGTCISNASTNGQTISKQVIQTANSSKSPTPSRSSVSSQASTITSTCSKNGMPGRPPKPPPPPRAHSLLPGNKNFKSSNGTFKCRDSSPCSIKCPDETESLPPKPQVPKRQFRPSMKSEYANLEAKNSVSAVGSDDHYSCPETENSLGKNSCDGNTYECIRTNSVGFEENDDDCQYQDVALPEDKGLVLEILEELQSSSSELGTTSCLEETVVQPFSNSETKWDAAVKSKASKTTESNYSISSKRGSSNIDTKDGHYHSTLSRNKHTPLTKAPSRPPPIYVKPQRVVNSKFKPWKVLENSYAMLSSNNREILIKLVECGMMKRPSLLEMKMLNLKWEDFKLDTGRPAVVYAFGDKIVHDATLCNDLDFQVTLVISIQSQSPGYDSSTQLKYPVLGHFNTNIPSNLLQADIQENHVETVCASVCVIHRAEVITIENFIEDLPESNTEELDRELCFILLQLIKGLKVLQAQGIESIDASFQNLILCKTESDNMHTLVFLSDNMFEDTSDMYRSVSENSKISLCQYALMLFFQLIKIESCEELTSSEKFGSVRKSSKIFISSITLLKEEKAVSLSQVKTLLECYIWGVQSVLQETDPSDYDSVLQRWMDIERSNFVKSLISKSQLMCLSTEEEFYSDFLVRTNIRSIKDITEFM